MTWPNDDNGADLFWIDVVGLGLVVAAAIALCGLIYSAHMGWWTW